MPIALINPVNGNVSSCTPNSGGDDFLENILIELRVISAILLAQHQNTPLIETVEQLRQDVTTEIPNPPI